SGEGPFVPNVHISTDVNRFEPMGSESWSNQTASMPFAGDSAGRAAGRWDMPSFGGAGPLDGPKVFNKLIRENCGQAGWLQIVAASSGLSGGNVPGKNKTGKRKIGVSFQPPAPRPLLSGFHPPVFGGGLTIPSVLFPRRHP